MKGLVKLYSKPKLNSPNMLAAWPGISNVAIIAANYLLRKLDFKQLGELNASHFFDPIGVMAKDSVVEAPSFPQSRFYYLKNNDGANDLIVFIGDAQPASKSYELAHCVLDTALKFEVSRVYTCAAALTRIHHTEQPRVWGVATNEEVAQDLVRYNLTQKGDLQIAGLNGLLLGAAKERDISGLCLLGEVPTYTAKMQNPMAALAILEVLTRLLGVNPDLNELAKLAAETRERMKQVAAQAMGEYIDYFTTPIWESEGEEEEEEEED